MRDIIVLLSPMLLVVIVALIVTLRLRSRGRRRRNFPFTRSLVEYEKRWKARDR